VITGSKLRNLIGTTGTTEETSGDSIRRGNSSYVPGAGRERQVGSVICQGGPEALNVLLKHLTDALFKTASEGDRRSVWACHY
jgi:hypothetical protein